MPQVPYNAPLPATLVSGRASSANNTIGTPPTNNKIRAIALSLGSNATVSTAGEVRITVALNGTTIFTDSVYVPASASNTPGQIYDRVVNFEGFSFNVGNSGGNLTVTLGSALSTGALNVNAYFTA